MLNYNSVFNTHSEYTNALNEGFERPHMTHCLEENKMHYNKAFVSITANLSGDFSTEIEKGSSFSHTFINIVTTVATKTSVKMGGVDITGSVVTIGNATNGSMGYKDVIVNIPRVTDSVVISNTDFTPTPTAP